MTSNSQKNRKSSFTRIISCAFAVVLLAGGIGACDGGKEGDRCNPLQTDHNECGAGLSCQMPSSCVENYCCPTPASKSSDPYCNGSSCTPASDAGVAGAAGATSTTSVGGSSSG